MIHRVKGGSVSARVIRKMDIKGIVSSICRGDSTGCIAHKLYRSSLKDSITDYFLKTLNVDSKSMCSTRFPSCLRRITPANLQAMMFSLIDVEMMTEAPLYYKTLSCMAGGSTSSTVVAGAVTLFQETGRCSLIKFLIIVGQQVRYSHV